MNTFKRRPVPAVQALRLGAVALASAGLVLIAGCGDKKEGGGATQTAAKVNDNEITVHQINYVLQQQRGLKPEQVDAAGRRALERLIDQELALQKADAMKLDRDPRVVQQLEMARREIIARAFLEKLGEAVAKPTAEEIKKYYDEKPALFSQRRVYQLQELTIEAKPEQFPGLREKLGASKTIAEFIEYLKASDIRFAANQAVRAAEQLPLASLDAFARMKDGQAMVNQGPNGLQIIVLAGSRSQPVDEERARPVIEQFLANDRKRKLVEDELKRLRAEAKISYAGKFAEGTPPAATGGDAAASETTVLPAVGASDTK